MKKKRVHNKFEIFIDTLIPYCVIVLLGLIVGDLFFHKEIENYNLFIVIIDWIIVIIFTADLYFKYQRAKSWKKFLRSSWLDILAVFPFFLIFRVWEEISLFLRVTTTEIRQSQSIFHEAVEIQKGVGRWAKEATRLAQEAENLGKISRSRYLIRIIRPVARIPRLLKIIPFFERPIKKHH